MWHTAQLKKEKKNTNHSLALKYISYLKIYIWVEFDFDLFSLPGNIRNTEKLSYDRQQQYEIQVTAWDCGQKRALHSVTVHIDVKPVCKPGWQG